MKRVQNGYNNLLEKNKPLQVLTSPLDTLINHVEFTAHPKTEEQINRNRELRAQQIINSTIKSEWGQLPKKQRPLVQDFWANQAAVMIDILDSSLTLFDGTRLTDASISHDELCKYLKEALHHLNNPEFVQTLCDRIDNSREIEEDESEASEKPTLSYMQADAITVANEKAQLGHRVLLMVPENLASFGDGTTNSMHDQLCRTSDLFIQQMRHFNSTHFSPNSSAVHDAKRDFLALMLFGVYSYLRDPESVTRYDFLRQLYTYHGTTDFDEHANSRTLTPGTYFTLQNQFHEIPASFGHLVEIRCKSQIQPHALFQQIVFEDKNELNFEIDAVESTHITLFQVSPYNKKYPQGMYGRACSYNPVYQDKLQSTTVTTEAFTSLIDTAIENNYDTIIFNAYGCDKAGQNPKKVAKIFASVLASRADALAGKHIIFADTDPKNQYLRTFGCQFSRNDFHNTYTINPSLNNEIQIKLIPEKEHANIRRLNKNQDPTDGVNYHVYFDHTHVRNDKLLELHLKYELHNLLNRSADNRSTSMELDLALPILYMSDKYLNHFTVLNHILATLTETDDIDALRDMDAGFEAITAPVKPIERFTHILPTPPVPGFLQRSSQNQHAQESDELSADWDTVNFSQHPNHQRRDLFSSLHRPRPGNFIPAPIHRRLRKEPAVEEFDSTTYGRVNDPDSQSKFSMFTESIGQIPGRVSYRVSMLEPKNIIPKPLRNRLWQPPGTISVVELVPDSNFDSYVYDRNDYDPIP